ncbi:CRISPR-associated protein Cas4 [Mariniblastus fucicola]|uniref:CRISPR-associated exonuclease Cas4 n=1 Tax=Mariniblastus fucicola TaxID=980251 RepID=A0A5B9PRU0_9BACT|nr:CRISPR-associated protein Cas4 [Mariniblastus fucicola]QEG25231.1 CRISPR-associated protein Cas4/endonuclease Cas1 fusion [Mariniblastus fucicola]
MFTDNQLLPISALQHLIFCERQCALIHVEQLWAENVLTVEGRHLHDKAHDGPSETARDIRIARGLWLKSNRLGLIGQADVVEFHRGGVVRPIEYKRGKPKKDASDRIQLCAQTLCLEEMLETDIDEGFLFYGTRKRRTKVEFDASIRDLTMRKIERLRQMIEDRETPTARRMPKCEKCSLVELCLPDSQRFRNGVAAWNDRQFHCDDDVDDVPETDPFDIGLDLLEPR